MTPEERRRLLILYRNAGYGHTKLPDAEYAEYAALRKKEYTDTKAAILAANPTATVRASKDDAGDIVGWTTT